MRLLITVIYILLHCQIYAQSSARSREQFDEGWKFFLGGAQGAEKPTFNDSSWRLLDLPHDWSIEDIAGTASPFSRGAIGQAASGFTTGGTGWYRKSFTIPLSAKGKLFQVQFDGVYMNAEVWLNGKRLGRHPYGYTSFQIDIAKQLLFGEKNVISVKVRNQGENSRWYSGSGIYRHVWLSSFNPVHIDSWGTAFQTARLDDNSAEVAVSEKIMNAGTTAREVRLIVRLIDPLGNEAGKTEIVKLIPADSSVTISGSIPVNKPLSWSPDQPRLYKTASELYDKENLIDHFEGNFGLRTISVNAISGFLLNGKPIKLQGGCIHHDNGPLGARAFDRAEERKIALLKASGFNAVRTAHNPASPAMLDACDRLGMMVIDEAFDMWKDGKNLDDYHLNFDEWWKADIESMVMRDRNHASVVMWSTGNEIPGREKASVVKVAAMLADHIRSIDPSRPITCGVNGIEENKDPFIATLDVAGYNYAPDKYAPDHQRLPARVMMATESFALDAFDYWMPVKDNAFVIGDFVWTAFDYIGEASLGWRGYNSDQNFYPWTLAFSGDLDICGWKRPQSYYRDVLWKKDQISIFVTPPRPSIEADPPRLANMRWQWHDEVADWNWKGYENKALKVNVYSDATQVELFLNGKSLGKKENGRQSKFTSTWNVPYAAGSLKAIGYNSGKQASVTEIKNAATAGKIGMVADRTEINADGQDLSYITISILDKEGIPDPKNQSLVHFQIEGDATIAGVGNANPVSTESYQLPERKAWRGKCLVVIKAGKKPGKIKLTARSSGLAGSELTIVSGKTN